MFGLRLPAHKTRELESGENSLLKASSAPGAPFLSGCNCSASYGKPEPVNVCFSGHKDANKSTKAYLSIRLLDVVLVTAFLETQYFIIFCDFALAYSFYNGSLLRGIFTRLLFTFILGTATGRTVCMGRMPMASASCALLGVLARVIGSCCSALTRLLVLAYQVEKFGGFRGSEETDRLGRVFPR